MQVLVTRPKPHNQQCVKTLQAFGYSAIAAPMVDIKASQQLAQLNTILAADSTVDLVIAVSQYAVESCQQFVQQQRLNWPSSLQYLAVGKATAECWQQYGVKALVPARQDSEGMLQLIDQQLQGVTRATILRGQQGREWLAQKLQAKGIEVSYVTCYQRNLISYSEQQLEHWRSQINTIIATSGEILKHLTTLTSTPMQRAWLKGVTLLVPSQRLLEYAKSLGFVHIVLCEGASDMAFINALAQISSSARNKNDQR
ncbi:uroporphyrinogen-III synthase [Agarivorans sp. MS3-6]